MATQITLADVKKVISLLVGRLGENYTSRDNRYLTNDNWDVHIAGWDLSKKGWSRGFMIGDHVLNRGYVGPKHDEGRYEGRGWHQRMADDIVAAVETLRG